MKIQLSQSEVELERRQVMCLAEAAGVRIVARGGALWVTQDHDRRDVVLQAGDSFVVPAGFAGTWEVLEDSVKLYAIFESR